MMIIEVMGAPAKYLDETLEKISDDISKEAGVKILSKNINESKELEERKGLFTNFMEIEVETDSLSHLSILIFKYMPAHIEIISPENINLTNNTTNEVFNEIVRRLHGYDNLARIFQHEKAKLTAELEEAKKLLEKKK